MERDLAFHKPSNPTKSLSSERLSAWRCQQREQSGERGDGVGRPLSYQVADDLASHSLVRLLPEYEPPPLPVLLVTTSAQHLAPKVRSFLDHATRSFATLDVIRRWS